MSVWKLETTLERAEREAQVRRRRAVNVFAAVVIALLVLLWLAGCTSSAGPKPVWHVWAPSTWPIFSGASTVNHAAAADQRADTARAGVQAVTIEATHAAHLEFEKANLTLSAIANRSPEVERARRFLSNGLGLLSQFDALSGVEAVDLRKLVADFASADPVRTKGAERAQMAAESGVAEVSQRLTAAETKATTAETKARQANVSARAAAMENIDLANELRTWKWALFWVGLFASVVALLGFYARLQLGGVGAALHAAGAPAAFVEKIDANTSALGQWFMRTGRAAAAKVAAVRSVVHGEHNL